MWIYLVKLITSASIIVIVSELGKRVSWLAALIASLPLTSIIALCWIYFETKNIEKITELSNGILFATIPSLLFFFVLSNIFRYEISFIMGLAISLFCMLLGYSLYVFFLKII